MPDRIVHRAPSKLHPKGDEIIIVEGELLYRPGQPEIVYIFIGVEELGKYFKGNDT